MGFGPGYIATRSFSHYLSIVLVRFGSRTAARTITLGLLLLRQILIRHGHATIIHTHDLITHTLCNIRILNNVRCQTVILYISLGGSEVYRSIL